MTFLSPAPYRADALPAYLRAHGSRSPAVSVAVALAVTGLFLASANSLRLPALASAAIFLFIAVEHEVRSGHIAREFAFAALLCVLALSAILAGPTGLGRAAAGAGVCLALLLPVLALGKISAGDLLAGAALGGIWGIELLPDLALWSCAAGLALAVLLGVMRSWDLRCAFALGRPPLSVAVGLGAAATQLWGISW
jgi:prepilin signal peptidase PulO-like enzyme (type II secretory pathway)